MKIKNAEVEIVGFSAYETAFECIILPEYARQAEEYLADALEELDDLSSCEKIEIYVEEEKTMCDGSVLFVFLFDGYEQGVSYLVYSYFLIK